MRSLLLEHGSAEWRRDQLVRSSWEQWLPEGGFHFMTKDTPYVPWDMLLAEQMKLLPTAPAPPSFKTIRGANAVGLPTPEIPKDTFFQTLYARRNPSGVRQRKAVAGERVAAAAHDLGRAGILSDRCIWRASVQDQPVRRGQAPGGGVSDGAQGAGARERQQFVSLSARAQKNRLARLPAPVSPRKASAYCAGQPYFSGAAALFIMTAVFARTMWKYGRARAYRVVLLEAGHLCQTFCLTATRLGLAPFCTAALKDSLIENDLGIDGITESVLYVAGVGAHPGKNITTS